MFGLTSLWICDLQTGCWPPSGLSLLSCILTLDRLRVPLVMTSCTCSLLSIDSSRWTDLRLHSWPPRTGAWRIWQTDFQAFCVQGIFSILICQSGSIWTVCYWEFWRVLEMHNQSMQHTSQALWPLVLLLKNWECTPEPEDWGAGTELLQGVHKSKCTLSIVIMFFFLTDTNSTTIIMWGAPWNILMLKRGPHTQKGWEPLA